MTFKCRRHERYDHAPLSVASINDAAPRRAIIRIERCRLNVLLEVQRFGELSSDRGRRGKDKSRVRGGEECRQGGKFGRHGGCRDNAVFDLGRSKKGEIGGTCEGQMTFGKDSSDIRRYFGRGIAREEDDVL